MSVDVFVVAAVRVYRESLCGALKSDLELNVVGEAATLADAIPSFRQLRPQVALLDVDGPGHLSLTVSPTAESEAKLIAVGVPESEALSWIEAGVCGCVCPDASLEDLTTAIVRVARGELVTSAAVAAELLHRLRSLAGEAIDSDTTRLTPREAEVLNLIAEGLSNKSIAGRLVIQEQTVKNHVHNILRKLGVHGRTEAVARMRRDDAGYRGSED